MYRNWCLLFFSLMLAGCPEPQSAIQRQIILKPELMQSFELSCKTCHQLPGHLAPQAHDMERWNELMNKGLSNLLASTLNGTGGMPPLGQCFECTDADLKQLILYMASPASDSDSNQSD